MFSNFDEVLKEVENIKNGTYKTKKELKERFRLISDTLSALSYGMSWPDLKSRQETMGAWDPDENYGITDEDIIHANGVIAKMLGGISLETFFGTSDILEMRGTLSTAQIAIRKFGLVKKISSPRLNRFF